MKVEIDYSGKRYTIIPETKDDEKFLEVFNKYIDKLEQENKELKDKIAKLEFDIEAWKKLKKVWEEKERMLNEKIGKLVMK